MRDRETDRQTETERQTDRQSQGMIKPETLPTIYTTRDIVIRYCKRHCI